MRCARVSSRRGPLLHSRRGLEGRRPRSVADPGRAHRVARRARRLAVQVDLRDRPGRGRAPPDPARALHVAVRERVRPRDGAPPDDLLPHGAPRGRGPAARPCWRASRPGGATSTRRCSPPSCSRGARLRVRSRSRPAVPVTAAFHEVALDAGSRAAATEARGRPRTGGRVSSSGRERSSITPLALPFPLLDAKPAEDAGRAAGGASTSRGWCSSSSTRTTFASSSSPSWPRRTSAPPRRASSWWPSSAGTIAPSSSRPIPRAAATSPPDRATSSAACTGPRRAGRALERPRGAAARRTRRAPGCSSRATAAAPWRQMVARVRTRNLAVGFGVLALLGATGALLATGAQRARRLARQQMEFVAGVTHELNTPLAAIRSAGQNLADGIVTDAAQVRRYGEPHREGGRPPHRPGGPGARLRRHRVGQPRLRLRAAVGRRPGRRGPARPPPRARAGGDDASSATCPRACRGPRATRPRCAAPSTTSSRTR